MTRIRFIHDYNSIISVENLLLAWREFLRGKRKKKDVQEFELRLMDNIIDLHNDLNNREYVHGRYYAFKISDPKPRDIHKATVRDRLLHHAIYRQLYPFFDRTFVADSYSCRLNKGTHRALKSFRDFSRKASQNNTRTVWVLKCDVRKFFASIDHGVLLGILREYVGEGDVLNLISEVVGSFHSGKPGIGLPLGNLTSQLLVNIYMNKFDQFAKHKLKTEHYIRYADDFVIMSPDKLWFEQILLEIQDFLQTHLRLELHPDKVFIKTVASGVDFLGWVHFPDHRVLRVSTKRRMFKNLGPDSTPERLQSYLGMLKHGNAHKLRKLIRSSLSATIYP